MLKAIDIKCTTDYTLIRRIHQDINNRSAVTTASTAAPNITLPIVHFLFAISL